MVYEPETQEPLLRSKLIGFIQAVWSDGTEKLPPDILEQSERDCRAFSGWLMLGAGNTFKHPGFKKEKEICMVTPHAAECLCPQSDTGLIQG